MKIVCLDPGLRECGWAVFDKGILEECGLAVNPERKDRTAKAWLAMASEVARSSFPWMARPDLLVYEMMQVREKGAGRKNTSDLLPLVGVLGATAALLRAKETVEYLPKNWKGDIPKPIHQARVLESGVLDAQEGGVLQAAFNKTAKNLQHNIVDAVSIGLFHTGRILRNGTKA